MDNVQAIAVPAHATCNAEVLLVATFADDDKVYRVRIENMIFDLGIYRGQLAHVETASEGLPLPDYGLTTSDN